MTTNCVLSPTYAKPAHLALPITTTTSGCGSSHREILGANPEKQVAQQGDSLAGCEASQRRKQRRTVMAGRNERVQAELLSHARNPS